MIGRILRWVVYRYFSLVVKEYEAIAEAKVLVDSSFPSDAMEIHRWGEFNISLLEVNGGWQAWVGDFYVFSGTKVDALELIKRDIQLSLRNSV